MSNLSRNVNNAIAAFKRGRDTNYRVPAMYFDLIELFYSINSPSLYFSYG